MHNISLTECLMSAVQANTEQLIDSALRYLSRINLMVTTHALLERNGVDVIIEGELVHRGFISQRDGLNHSLIYEVNLGLIQQHLKQRAATNKGQTELMMA